MTLAQVAAHSHGPSRNSLDLTPTGGSFPVQVGGNREFGVSPTDSQGSGTAHNHAHTLTGTLTGNITTSLTGTVTAAGTNSFSPFVVVNYIIKH